MCQKLGAMLSAFLATIGPRFTFRGHTPIIGRSVLVGQVGAESVCSYIHRARLNGGRCCSIAEMTAGAALAVFGSPHWFGQKACEVWMFPAAHTPMEVADSTWFGWRACAVARLAVSQRWIYPPHKFSSDCGEVHRNGGPALRERKYGEVEHCSTVCSKCVRYLPCRQCMSA
jgi:hypothetical protein